MYIIRGIFIAMLSLNAYSAESASSQAEVVAKLEKLAFVNIEDRFINDDYSGYNISLFRILSPRELCGKELSLTHANMPEPSSLEVGHIYSVNISQAHLDKLRAPDAEVNRGRHFMYPKIDVVKEILDPENPECATKLADRDFSPIVRVAHIFPQSEPLDCGHALVVFDISKEGKTENIRIVDATTENFAAAAIKAVRQYKWKPRITDGEPVVVKDFMNVLRFQIEGANCERSPT